MYMDRFYGPRPSKMEQQYDREPTGIRLLELMQNGKGRALGQPKSLKKWRGRNPMQRYFEDDVSTNYDYRREHYW